MLLRGVHKIWCLFLQRSSQHTERQELGDAISIKRGKQHVLIGDVKWSE